MTQQSDIIIPSSPSDRQKLKMMISEITHCMSRIDLEKGSKSDIVNTIHEEFDLPKKFINKLASTMYKHNYDDLQAENSDFEMLYESIIGGSSSNDDEAE